jgi:hypothetical protein
MNIYKLKQWKRAWKLWRMSRSDKTLRRRIRRAKILKFFTNHKHYVIYDYQDRMIVVNTLMLEKFKKNRLIKRNWSKTILFETK